MPERASGRNTKVMRLEEVKRLGEPCADWKRYPDGNPVEEERRGLLSMGDKSPWAGDERSIKGLPIPAKKPCINNRDELRKAFKQCTCIPIPLQHQTVTRLYKPSGSQC